MKRFILTACLACALTPALAEGLATEADIQSRISSNTVQGSMMDAGAYTEFYDADGTIKGDGYTGNWSVENDQMCFDYGEGADCWSVRINGDDVVWIKDGEEDGTGMIVAGNPNNF